MKKINMKVLYECAALFMLGLAFVLIFYGERATEALVYMMLFKILAKVTDK